jgi:hypothetical protein
MPEFGFRERPAVALVFVVAVLGACVSLMSGCASETAPPSLARISTVNSMGVSPKTSAFTFTTIEAPGGPPTEILGINNLSKLCGFYGNPAIGFTVRPPYNAKQFYKQLYPGAAATVVTSINNTNVIAGWLKDSKGGIFGFTQWEGIWTKYQDNHLLRQPQYTKLLGLSDDELAVGYYQLKKIDHSFELNLVTGKFIVISPPNAKSSAATGINGKGDIVGWLTLANGVTEGWLLKDGIFTVFVYPSAAGTQAASLDWSDDIAGSFKDASGKTNGFLLTDVLKTQTWTKIDDPSASGETVVTGINNHHTMVGYYKDSGGKTSGFLANPKI